jgi:hypothetical protein
MDVTLERPRASGAELWVSRANGPEMPARLRLLGYEGCEFECDHGFAEGEQIRLHLDGMGSIRARITAQEGNVVEAEFVKDCPV